jgi:RNA polymerase sigma-70 factor (ECF subfamily)
MGEGRFAPEENAAVTAPAYPDDFEATALPYLNELYRTATRAVGNAAEAGDIVQETYLQAWKSYHRFTPGTNCRAWLYKIMFHVIQHHRRKQRRFVAVSVREDEPDLESTLRYEPPVPQTLSDAEVLAALDRLPDRYRDVVLLVDVDELTYKEAAAALDVPIGTVMSRLSRARATLRSELASTAAAYGITPGASRRLA